MRPDASKWGILQKTQLYDPLPTASKGVRSSGDILRSTNEVLTSVDKSIPSVNQGVRSLNT
jgi:hypothetical protein